jgi:hypothetical protein
VIIDPSSTLDMVHWSSSFLSSTHICSSLVMDRRSISSLVFDDNDGVNNYVIKTPLFGLQRAMQGIERLVIDIRQFEARTRDFINDMFDYLDKRLNKQTDDVYNERMDKHMEVIRQMLSNYKSSSPSSSSRRRRSSRTSSKCSSEASAIRPRPHLRDDEHHCIQGQVQQ